MTAVDRFREKSTWWFYRRTIESELSCDFWEGESDSLMNTVRILLSLLLVGTNADRIAKFLGLKRTFVRVRVTALRQNEIVRGQRICAEEWFDEKYGQLACLLDALVAEGYLEKKWT